jgi:hypothetical protein
MPNHDVTSNVLIALSQVRIKSLEIMAISFDWEPPDKEGNSNTLTYSASGRFYHENIHSVRAAFYHFGVEMKSSNDNNFTINARYFAHFDIEIELSGDEWATFFSLTGKSMVWPQFARLSEILLANAGVEHPGISLNASTLVVTPVATSGVPGGPVPN